MRSLLLVCLASCTALSAPPKWQGKKVTFAEEGAPFRRVFEILGIKEVEERAPAGSVSRRSMPPPGLGERLDQAILAGAHATPALAKPFLAERVRVPGSELLQTWLALQAGDHAALRDVLEALVSEQEGVLELAMAVEGTPGDSVTMVEHAPPPGLQFALAALKQAGPAAKDLLPIEVRAKAVASHYSAK